MDFMLKQLLIVLVLLAVTPYIVGIVLALLAKLRLLPLAVCGLVLSCLFLWRWIWHTFTRWLAAW